MRNLFIITTAILAINTPAVAQDAGIYASVGYAKTKLSVDNTNFDISLNAIQSRLGYQFNGMLGVEAEGSIGLGRYEISEGQSTIGVKLDHQIAGYVTGRLPVGGSVSVIGRAGYQSIGLSTFVNEPGQVEVEASGNGDGFVFGAGLEYDLGSFNIRGDYTYHDANGPFDDLTKADTFAISLVKKF